MQNDVINSSFKVIPREIRIKKYKDTPRHSIFCNEHTIKWFKTKCPENIIKKSIYSLLPNNGAQMLKNEPTQLNKIMEFLETYCKPTDKYQNLCINPKYFFSMEIFDKILKLKEIFLQFDEDGSRKMEIDEMVTMFQTNHIEVNEDELCSLFFKGKTYRKQDINKLYLDFYQFMQFALNKKSDQNFRVFMRKIKEKIMKEKREKTIKEQEKEDIRNFLDNQEFTIDKSDINNIIIDANNDNSILNNDEKNEPIFLPMNFNLVLDYFINKGKERKSQKKIRRAIKLMKNILNPGTYPSDDKDLLTDDDNNDDDHNKKDEHKDKEQENEYDTQLKEINTEALMEEFSKLFKMSYTTNYDTQKDIQSFRKQFAKSKTIKSKESPYQETEVVTRNRENKKSSTQKIEMKFKFNEPKQNKNQDQKPTLKPEEKTRMIFTDIIKDSLENKTVGEINMINYNKYKNVKLAKEETTRFFSKKTKRVLNNSNHVQQTVAYNKKVNLPIIKSDLNKGISKPIKIRKSYNNDYLFT